MQTQFRRVVMDQWGQRQRIGSAPARAGITAGLVIAIVPLVLTLILAVACGIVVFILARILVSIGGLFGSGRQGASGDATPPDDVRRNVRIMQRR